MATLAMPTSPRSSRALAVVLLFVAVVLALALLIAPVLLLHRHYDVAIEGTLDHLDRYRRVAAAGAGDQESPRRRCGRKTVAASF